MLLPSNNDKKQHDLKSAPKELTCPERCSINPSKHNLQTYLPQKRNKSSGGLREKLKPDRARLKKWTTSAGLESSGERSESPLSHAASFE